MLNFSAFDEYTGFVPVGYGNPGKSWNFQGLESSAK